MCTELPVCKRCCFCVPLRYGLLTWGYLKLIVTTTVTVALVVLLVIIAKIREVNRQIYLPDLIDNIVVIVMRIVLFLLLTEMVLNVLFIVGGHMKNVKLLRIYYIYNFVIWVLSIVLFVVQFCRSFSTLAFYHPIIPVIIISSFFVNIAIQSYFLMLLRSEIIKLKINCQVQFSNNATEAECTMNIKE